MWRRDAATLSALIGEDLSLNPAKHDELNLKLVPVALVTGARACAGDDAAKFQHGLIHGLADLANQLDNERSTQKALYQNALQNNNIRWSADEQKHVEHKKEVERLKEIIAGYDVILADFRVRMAQHIKKERDTPRVFD